MIHFHLRCAACDCAFDGWFRSGGDFDTQSAKGLVACPSCGSGNVEKALMAPAVSRAEPVAAPPAQMGLAGGTEAQMLRKLQALGREMRARADYVGNGFAEEARRIHFGEAKARGIYGEATPQEVRKLLDDGVPAVPLPPLPEDRN